MICRFRSSDMRAIAECAQGRLVTFTWEFCDARLCCAGSLRLGYCAAVSKDAERFAKWEKEVATLEKKTTNCQRRGIVFAGSSTIRLWNLRAHSQKQSTAVSAGRRSAM